MENIKTRKTYYYLCIYIYSIYFLILNMRQEQIKPNSSTQRDHHNGFSLLAAVNEVDDFLCSSRLADRYYCGFLSREYLWWTKNSVTLNTITQIYRIIFRKLNFIVHCSSRVATFSVTDALCPQLNIKIVYLCNINGDFQLNFTA